MNLIDGRGGGRRGGGGEEKKKRGAEEERGECPGNDEITKLAERVRKAAQQQGLEQAAHGRTGPAELFLSLLWPGSCGVNSWFHSPSNSVK